MKKVSKFLLLTSAATLASSATLLADEIKCKDGSVIIGTIESVEDGIITVANAVDDAGTTKIKQSEVVSIATADSLFVRTPDNNTVLGKIVPAEEGGKMKVDGGSVQSELDIAQFVGVWRQGDLSPEEKAAKSKERHWEYELGFSLLGKTGNTESISVGLSAQALMKTPDDALKFYINYNYGKTKDSERDADSGEYEWTKSADDLHAGGDYENNISEFTFWYAREDLGFDKIKNIKFLSTSAAGLGYRIVEEDDWHFSVRAGFSYRYESYKNYMHTDDWDNPDDTSAAGLDFGLHHDYSWGWGKIVTDITYTPTFEDFFGDYLATHETYVDFKVDSVDYMSVRFGVKNEYRGETASLASRNLDTTYYAQINFSWK